MTTPTTQNVTLKLRSSSEESPQVARIIVSANGDRAVSFVQNGTDDDRALVFKDGSTKPACTASVDKFNALFDKINGPNLVWTKVESDLQESRTQAALPNLTTLCKSPTR